MDISELVTGALAVLVLLILGIDTVTGWRTLQRSVNTFVPAAAPARHSFDSNISCDIVWC